MNAQLDLALNSSSDLLGAALPTPSRRQLAKLRIDTSCIPSESDRRYWLARLIYDATGLDWRNPAHAAHVAALVTDELGPVKTQKTWARVND